MSRLPIKDRNRSGRRGGLVLIYRCHSCGAQSNLGGLWRGRCRRVAELRRNVGCQRAKELVRVVLVCCWFVIHVHAKHPLPARAGQVVAVIVGVHLTPTTDLLEATRAVRQWRLFLSVV